MKLYSRTVDIRDTSRPAGPAGVLSYTVTDTSFLSRSRASFAALDEAARNLPRQSLSLESVSELTTREDSEIDRDWNSPAVS